MTRATATTVSGLALTLVILLALPSAAEAVRLTPEPSFFIETISVEGARQVSPEIILSESLLEAGKTYSESQLLEAIYRINRLPFVLEARFSLGRGSARGKLVLRIEVDEVRRFFFGSDAVVTRFSQPLALEGTFPEESSTRLGALVGLRYFPGNYGVVFAAAGAGGALQAGYTRYQLFGRRAFLSLGYLHADCCPTAVVPLGLDPTFSSWSSDEGSERATFTLGIPLDDNESLRVALSYRQGVSGRRRTVVEAADPGRLFLHENLTDQRLELAWIYDTTDDATFPSRGTAASAALEVRELAADFTDTSFADPTGGAFTSGSFEPPLAMRSRMLRATFAASRHWPVAQRQALSVTVRLAVGRSEIESLPVGDAVLRQEDLDLWEAGAAFRHAVNLWRAHHAQRPRELHWENLLEVGYEGTSPDLDLPENPHQRWSVSTTLALRTSWGIFRFGFSYVDVGRTLTL